MPVTRFEFPAGVDLSTPPQRLRPSSARVLRNFLPGRPGRGWLRGFVHGGHGGNTAITTTTQQARVVHDSNSFLVGLELAAEAGNWVRHVDDTGTITNVSVTQADRPRGSTGHTRLGDFTYYIADHNDIMRWDGSATLGTRLTNGPLGSLCVKAYLNRLFVLGGQPAPGGGTFVRNVLYWSDDGGPVANTLAEWQDNVTGLTNQITLEDDLVPSLSTSGAGGLAVLDGGLLISLPEKTWLMRGSSPSTFTIRPIASYGTNDARSIVEYGGGCFMLTRDCRYVFCDGVSFTDVSAPVADRLRPLGGVAGVSAPEVTALLIGSDMIALMSESLARALLFHIPSQTWSEWDEPTAVMQSARPITGAYGDDDPFVWTGRGLQCAELVTQPENVLNAGYGRANSSNNLDAEWQTVAAPLAQPGQRVKISRVGLDYEFQFQAAPPGNATGWLVELRDGRGNVLLPETSVPFDLAAQADGTTRRRWVTDLHTEAEDAQFTISMPALSGAPLKRGFVHEAWVEWEPIHRTRGQ